LTSKREQFYKRCIAELEAQLKQRDQRIATLEKQVTELLKANAGLTEQVTRLTDKIAKLSKNSSKGVFFERRLLKSKAYRSLRTPTAYFVFGIINKTAFSRRK